MILLSSSLGLVKQLYPQLILWLIKKKTKKKKTHENETTCYLHIPPLHINLMRETYADVVYGLKQLDTNFTAKKRFANCTYCSAFVGMATMILFS